jgi:hypothetical protein
LFGGHLCGLMVKKLSDHVKRQHMERDLKKFVCELCGERFKGQSGYQFHLAGKPATNVFFLVKYDQSSFKTPLCILTRSGPGRQKWLM